MVIETGEKKLICIGVHASCQSKVSPGPQAPHFESHPSSRHSRSHSATSLRGSHPGPPGIMRRGIIKTQSDVPRGALPATTCCHRSGLSIILLPLGWRKRARPRSMRKEVGCATDGIFLTRESHLMTAGKGTEGRISWRASSLRSANARIPPV